MRCGCPGWKKVKDLDDMAWTFLFTHGIKYPDDGSKWKYCPMCGKELKKEK